MMLSLTQAANFEASYAGEENSSFEAEAAGLLYPTVTPSQKLLATGITSSNNVTKGWEHFFGIWKLFRDRETVGPQL